MLVQILELFAGEIRYGKTTLPESCRIIAGRVREPYKSGLTKTERIYVEMGGVGFKTVFREQMEIATQKLPIGEGDREMFYESFEHRGFADACMQLKGLERGMEGLRNSIRIQESELREKKRMAMGLGAMGGVLIVILLA